MYEVYDKWPTISHDSYNYDHEQTEFTEVDHIVFTGMGGSSLLENLCQDHRYHMLNLKIQLMTSN